MFRGVAAFAGGAIPAAGTISWSGRSQIDSPADGSVRMRNAAGTSGFRLTATGDGLATLQDIAGSAAGRLVLGDGAAATPALAFSGATNTGFFRASGGTIVATIGGADRIGLFSTALILGSGVRVTWSSSTGVGSGDTILGRSSAGVVSVLDGSSNPATVRAANVAVVGVATGSLPAAPEAGTVVYDSTLNKLKVWTGAAYETVTSA